MKAPAFPLRGVAMGRQRPEPSLTLTVAGQERFAVRLGNSHEAVLLDALNDRRMPVQAEPRLQSAVQAKSSLGESTP